MNTKARKTNHLEAQAEVLNQVFTEMTFEERLSALYTYFSPDDVLITSSFGTQSVFLLHLLHRIAPGQQVYFINTGYLFPETLAYRDQLVDNFGIHLTEIHPETGHHQLTRNEKMWQAAPDLCCYYNKVKPLEPLRARHKVWVSGVMGYQTPHRAGLRVFEPDQNNLKFHPLIDIDEGEFLYYMSYYDLPRHPLEARGYGSVGCTHCTVKGKGREGRWKGHTKTECGLHTNAS